MNRSRFQTARRILIFWTLFIGLRAGGRRIIFWCTTRRIHTGMPPRRWIGFWGFSIVDFEVYSAEKGK